MPAIPSLDLNADFLQAYHILENSRRHVLITGQAGTGKSTLLKYFREHTTKQVVVLAPTGVAAVNVGGQTLHSFFRLRPDMTAEKVAKIRLRKEDKELFHQLEAVMIDEVSMVRADVLDCVDRFLRLHGPHPKKVFGGVQMIFIGDLYQLPPVVPREEEGLFREFYDSPYFFSAKVFENLDVEFIDLGRIYRQQEDTFIELLNAVRHKTVTPAQMNRLNERCRPHFDPPPEDFYVYLATTNAAVDRMNAERLHKLPGKVFTLTGKLEGDFERKNLPTHVHLEIKIGAQVMLLNNDSEDRWVNGSIGKVLAIHDDLTAMPVVEVELENQAVVEVSPFRWEMFRFFLNEATQAIASKSVGAFTQYPLKLAWAVTIHKSQGKTFSKMIVDLGSGAFSHGQTYVALSRCSSLEGLVLRRPVFRNDILLDPRVVRFMQTTASSTTKVT